MRRLSVQLGFWSALAMVVTFAVGIIAFASILFVSPLFIWTNYPAYVDYVSTYDQSLKYAVESALILFGALYVVLRINDPSLTMLMA